MIKGAGPDECSTYADVWSGQIAASWTPTEPGTRPRWWYAGVDVPAQYAAATQVWITPADGAIGSCIDWFDLNPFVERGMVQGVTVQLGSP